MEEIRQFRLTLEEMVNAVALATLCCEGEELKIAAKFDRPPTGRNSLRISFDIPLESMNAGAAQMVLGEVPGRCCASGEAWAQGFQDEYIDVSIESGPHEHEEDA